MTLNRISIRTFFALPQSFTDKKLEKEQESFLVRPSWESNVFKFLFTDVRNIMFACDAKWRCPINSQRVWPPDTFEYQSNNFSGPGLNCKVKCGPTCKCENLVAVYKESKTSCRNIELSYIQFVKDSKNWVPNESKISKPSKNTRKSLPSLSAFSTSAPQSSRILTISSFFSCTANVSGVQPSTLLWLISAPFSRKNVTKYIQ